MMKARAFFYVSAGLFLLALSYHLGASSAGAQTPGNPVVAGAVLGNNLPVALTANGDAYYLNGVVWTRLPNVFGSGPTPAQQESFGSVKARYR